MFHLLTVFLLSLFFIQLPLPSSLEAGKQDQKIFSEVVELARQYRKDSDLSTREDKQRKAVLLEKVDALLPRYKKYEKLEQNVAAFIQTVLKKKYEIVNAADTNLRGHSQDRVFFLKDTEGALKYIVKAFYTGNSHFLAEVSALDRLIELHFAGGGLVYPVAAAKGRNADREYTLLLETAAAGKRMDQYLQAISDAKNSPKRKEALEEAVQALSRTGEHLAKLHSIKSEPLPLPSKIFNKFDRAVKGLQEDKKVQTLFKQENIDVKKLLAYLSDLRREVSFLEVPRTYLHGDAHLGNMFYDITNDHFYFIDVFHIHDSMDQSGAPLSDGILDFMRAQISLESKASKKLKQAEIDLLVAAYRGAYGLESGSLPEKQLSDFHTASIHLLHLLKDINKPNKKIFEYFRHVLESADVDG